MRRVYFDKLDPSITRDHLKEFFSRAGEVGGVLLFTDRSGKSRGFGFVEMHAEDAKFAIKTLGKALIKGKPIHIDAASSRG